MITSPIGNYLQGTGSRVFFPEAPVNEKKGNRRHTETERFKTWGNGQVEQRFAGKAYSRNRAAEAGLAIEKCCLKDKFSDEIYGRFSLVDSGSDDPRNDRFGILNGFAVLPLLKPLADIVFFRSAQRDKLYPRPVTVAVLSLPNKMTPLLTVNALFEPDNPRVYRLIALNPDAGNAQIHDFDMLVGAGKSPARNGSQRTVTFTDQRVAFDLFSLSSSLLSHCSIHCCRKIKGEIGMSYSSRSLSEAVINGKKSG